MNLIEKLGLEKCRQIVDGAPSNAESYQDGYYFRESPEFQFHNRIHEQWNLTDNNGDYFKKRGFDPVLISDLRTALADNDRIDTCSDIRNIEKKKELEDQHKKVDEVLEYLDGESANHWGLWKEKADMLDQGASNAFEEAYWMTKKALRGEHV